jgi:hypothetical protein
LAAHAADDTAVVQGVGDRCPERRHHHAGVDKAGMAAFASLAILLAIDFVDKRHRHHA